MLRKLCKGILVLAVLGAGPGTLGARAQNASATAPAAEASLSDATSAAEADVWYKTATYIFQHDQELQPIANKLVAKLNKNSLNSFRRSLEDAIKVEGKALRDSRVLTFQNSFKEIQAQQPASPAALVAAIEASKLGVKRKDDQQFQALMQSLTPPTETAATQPAASVATATTLAADNPVNDNGAPLSVARPVAPAAPTPGMWLWLALGTAGLSLLGVAVLWNKLANTREKLAVVQRTVEVFGQKPAGTSTAPPTLTNAIKQEITRQIDQRVAEKQAKAPVVAAPLPPEPSAPPVAPVMQEATPPVAAPPVPAPRLRTQYVGEAPFNNTFPARALSDQPGTYSMFAIESSEEQPEQGTFAVTGNLASHVRDHRSVLEPVCEYVGGYPLGSESRVVTEQPGVVRRRGGDWEVVQRAKVRFE
jgi:hypothetical protein